MHYTVEELREQQARFVVAFLQQCDAAKLPLSAPEAMDYSATGWRVEFCVENYRSRIGK